MVHSGCWVTKCWESFVFIRWFCSSLQWSVLKFGSKTAQNSYCQPMWDKNYCSILCDNLPTHSVPRKIQSCTAFSVTHTLGRVFASMSLLLVLC